MDSAISKLQFLRKILLLPTGDAITQDFMSHHADYMSTDLGGMDASEFRHRIRYVMGWSQERIRKEYHDSVTTKLHDIANGRNSCKITNPQMQTLLEMMNFFLSHAHLCQSESTGVGRDICYDLLWQLNTFLLTSNKLVECAGWVKEHLPELKTLRNTSGDSLLHMAAKRPRIGHPRVPFVKLLVEEGEMDVDVVNFRRETPLHLLSFKLFWELRTLRPRGDMIEVSELLINNGAHMDAMDDRGFEASFTLSQNYPKWSFNFKLKCLAARAILKHGVRYEICMPAKLISFIESHKPVSVRECGYAEHNTQKMVENRQDKVKKQ